MQSITTKYLGPSGTPGARIAAKTTSGIRKLFPYDHELSDDANHKQAAYMLADSLSWQGSWVEGALQGNERVFVLLTGEEAFRV